MSSILYYSNFCEHSKKIIQTLSKTQVGRDIHFICIDNRQKDANGKVYIILPNGQKIVMANNVTKVPALLLLNDNYRVIYGDEILSHLKPRQEQQVMKATYNNAEPMAFGFGGFSGVGSGVASDNYSFYDMKPEDLTTKGNGGMYQMHSYSGLNDNFTIQTPTDDFDYKSSKSNGGSSLEALQKQRDQDLAQLGFNKPPPGANR